MASGAESRPHMDKVSELRKKFLDKHYASDKNYYDSRDIARVKSDNLFVQQYTWWDEMIEALRWRKEFGINVFITQTKFTKGGKEKLMGYKKLFASTYEKIDNDFNKFISFVQSTVYPALMENAYVLSLPKLLEGIWKIFKGFLGSRLSNKYIFTTVEELSTKYIDKDQLPLEYGGPSFEYKYLPEDKTDSNSNKPATAEVIS